MKSTKSSWPVKAAILMLASGAAPWSGIAFAQGARTCDTGPVVREASWRPEWVTALNRAFAPDQCNSILRVLALMSNRPKAAGRDLAAPKPLDRQAAASDLQRLRSDPEYLQLYARASAGETDPVRLRVLQAATLDDMGEFRARDLVIDQMVQGR